MYSQQVKIEYIRTTMTTPNAICDVTPEPVSENPLLLGAFVGANGFNASILSN